MNLSLLGCEEGRQRADEMNMDSMISTAQGDRERADMEGADIVGADMGSTVRDRAVDTHTEDTSIDSEVTDDSPLEDSFDSDPSDATRDGGMESHVELYAQLSIDEAHIEGDYSRLEDGLILLDANAKVRWSLPSELIPRGAHISLTLVTRIWRYEDGAIRVHLNQGVQRAIAWGDGRAQPTALRQRYEEWHTEGYGVERIPPRLDWIIDDPLDHIEIESEQGGLIIGDLYIHGVNAPLPERHIEDAHLEDSDPDETLIQYMSCLPDPDCDDGLALTTAIEEAPLGPLKILLKSPSYHAKTPVLIRRSDLTIIGDPPEINRPTWGWSPTAGSGQKWPFELRGGGPEGGGHLVRGELRPGQRVIDLVDLVEATPEWVRLTAMDFGDVPLPCLDGRDVERYNRHQRQLFRVIESEPHDGYTRLTLDRAINLALPEETAPTLTPTRLLTGLQLGNIHLLADCPEALASTFMEVECTNPEVLDDGGVLSLYTEGALFQKISAQGFGKFTIEIRDSLLNVVEECSMDHPSAYGSGGQGYGVHLIGASRSLIVGERVSYARHGVVIDFGSSDSQVLEGEFSHMNQALIDVHGEASRDTLIRGNRLERGGLGVIIGGGGRAVHCNDGPRHHVIDNTITDCGISAVTISDYTQQSMIRSNTMRGNGTHVATAFGAHAILIERNDMSEATIKPISVAFDRSRDVTVLRNLFQDVCTPEEATLILVNGETPTFMENLWCP